MSELRRALECAAFKNIKTHIQSGNVVFDCLMRSNLEIALSIGQTIQDTFGFNIPVYVIGKKELKLILSQSPYDSEEQISANKTYLVFLFQSPQKQLLEIFNSLSFPNEQFQVIENCVHLLCTNGYGKAKLNNNLVESKLKVIATTRNYKSVKKVL